MRRSPWAEGVTFPLSAVTQVIRLPENRAVTGVRRPSRHPGRTYVVTPLARFKAGAWPPKPGNRRFSAIARRWHGDCSLYTVQAGKGERASCDNAPNTAIRSVPATGWQCPWMAQGYVGTNLAAGNRITGSRHSPVGGTSQSIPPQGGHEGGNPATPVAGAPMEAPDPTPAGRGPSFFFPHAAFPTVGQAPPGWAAGACSRW